VDRLAQHVEATADRAVGTVSITATDEDPARAVLLANTFATEVVDFLEDRDADRLEQTANDLAATADSLRQRIADLEATIAGNPPNVETVTAERDALIRELGDVIEDQEAATTAVRYSTLQEATKASEVDRLPGTGSRLQRMALAGLVALVLGFGLAIMLDRSDTRLRRRQDAEERFGLPVIAEVPEFSFLTRHRRLVIAAAPDSAKAEAYRTLRSALMLIGRRNDGLHPATAPASHPPTDPASTDPAGADLASTDPASGASSASPTGAVSTNGQGPSGNRTVIMITSPSASEGKSTTTANLAVAYAETGARVLVLSCDLWRSGIARRFKVKLGRGISDFLSAGTPVPLSRFVRSTTVHGVRIVTSGVAARRRGGTLVAQRRLIDEARGLADVVLLDTTPILSASITRELATVVDAVVVVCRVGRTTAAEAERCRDLLTQLGAPALGVVLVGVSGPPLADYFAYFAPRRDRAPSTKRTKATASKTAKATPPRAKEPTAAPEPSASEADAADEALGDGHAAERPDPAEQR
jgi:capsular exopolysaccharide synthesis family protein